VSANSFGNLFKITTFGESHGSALGVVVEGCPAGVPFNYELLLQNLERRRPGLAKGTSARNENDQPEILSGVFKGLTLGTPLAMIVRNQDARSQDYEEIENQPRIGHADDVWKNKFGQTDHRGGGRASGRETVARVMGGSVAQMLVQKLCPSTKVSAHPLKIGPHEVLAWPDSNIIHFLEKAQSEGESYGGIAGVDIIEPPQSLGQPVFHKLKSDLASACLSVGATTAFELGSGIESTIKPGSAFHHSSAANEYGGIRGGISTGETIRLKVHFKPTSSIMDVAKKGRHDPCIVPRALPVLETMVWLVLADHVLWKKLDRFDI
jgi:chorismate synthase